MVFRHAYAHGAWIDLEQPTEEEIRRITREFNIGERIETELIAPTPTPLVASEDDAALIVLHFPVHDSETGASRTQELDFVVGRDFVITVRYEVIASLHEVRKLLEADELVFGRTKFAADVLLEVLFAHLYASIRDHVQFLAGQLTAVETRMFDGYERSTIRTISNISREFLHLEASLASQEEPLSRFLTLLSEHGFFGHSFKDRANRLMAERLQVGHLIRTHRAVASELRETNASLIETTQNSIMRTLTVVNVIFLPMGLVAWIFAMRTEGMPFISSEHSFYGVLGFMLLIGLTLTTIFVKKRWI